jgi:adenosine/AMP kinase
VNSASLFSSDISYCLIYGIIILTFYLILLLFSSDLTSHAIKASYSVIDSFDDLLAKYPSLKAFVSINGLDLPKLMQFGTEDEKMVITQAIESGDISYIAMYLRFLIFLKGDTLKANFLETLNAVPNITQMIASKTHVFLAGFFEINIISGRIRGVEDPSVYIARDCIFPRPMGVFYRNDLDEYLMNILNQV